LKSFEFSLNVSNNSPQQPVFPQQLVKFPSNHFVPSLGLEHSIKEIEVSTRLTLSSQKDYLKGDNSDIIATDSQKNTVYVLAKKYGVKSPEDFATILCRHFLSTYSHVTKAVVEVEQMMWNRVSYRENVNQKLHNHAFIHTPLCTRFAVVTLERGGKRCADKDAINVPLKYRCVFCLGRKFSNCYQRNQRHARAENNSKFVRKLRL
jgi:urate oxidase